MKQILLYLERVKAVLQPLSDAQAGLLFRRIVNYIDGQDQEAGDQLADAMFSVLKVDIDLAADRYETICERNRSNGKKGGRPRKASGYEENPENPVGFSETQENPEKPIKINKIKENINKPSKEGMLSVDNPHVEIDYEKLINYWNSQINNNGSILTKVTNIKNRRKIAVLARAKEFGKEALQIVIDKATKSDFLNGKNDMAWTATFDWIFLHPNNFIKVYEGNYDNKSTQTAGGFYTQSGKTASDRVDEALGLLDNPEQQQGI